ncbi:MAG: DUF4160 domain-containing protein [Terracidiphilus sp.]
MGSIRLDGVRFTAYTMDHEPRHVHGFYAEVELIVDLRLDGTVSLANRTDAIRPGNASKADVRHILNAAAKHFNELVSLWEKHHG